MRHGLGTQMLPEAVLVILRIPQPRQPRNYRFSGCPCAVSVGVSSGFCAGPAGLGGSVQLREEIVEAHGLRDAAGLGR